MKAHAIEMYNIKSIEDWLVSKRKIIGKCYNEEFPVHHAAKRGNIFELRHLVYNMKRRINDIDWNGNTPLMLACEAGKSEIVKCLLDMDAKVHNVNYAGNDALLIACLENRCEIVNLLLASNSAFNLSHRYDEDSKTILHLIAEVGDYPTLGIIAEDMGDCDKLDSMGNSALMIAAANNHLGQVKDLIDCVVDVNLQNPLNGFTALFYAAQGDHYDVVKYLLKNKADPYIANKFGEIPFFVASRSGYDDMSKLLIKGRLE